MLGFFCIFASMKIGNISINVEAHKYWTKEQFIAAYKGKVNVDINELWIKVCELNGVNHLEIKEEIENSGETSKQNKKSKR